MFGNKAGESSPLGLARDVAENLIPSINTRFAIRFNSVIYLVNKGYSQGPIQVPYWSHPDTQKNQQELIVDTQGRLALQVDVLLRVLLLRLHVQESAFISS